MGLNSPLAVTVEGEGESGRADDVFPRADFDSTGVIMAEVDCYVNF
jgi:hypothetical protein